jgi:hypothetical protein
MIGVEDDLEGGEDNKSGGSLNVTWEESTPRYTQLEVSLLSISLSYLAIRLDMGLIQG